MSKSKNPEQKIRIFNGSEKVSNSGQSKSWPDWQDSGRLVEVVLESGEIVQGELFVNDLVITEYDEVPIFVVRTEGDVEHSFTANLGWRFL